MIARIASWAPCLWPFEVAAIAGWVKTKSDANQIPTQPVEKRLRKRQSFAWQTTSRSRIEVINTVSTLQNKNIQQLIKLSVARTFVETGTYRGDSTAWAAEHFAQVYSIELGTTLYNQCVARFAQQKNVHLINGDSVPSLHKLLPTLNGRIFFWLDAHYSSRDTVKGEVSVPLLDELQVIASHPVKDHVIVIDDYRLFGWKNASGEEDWTTITETNVRQILRSINPQYRVFDARDVYIAATTSNLTFYGLLRSFLP